MKKNTGAIDINEEYHSIIKYIKTKWHLSELFLSCLKKTWEDGIIVFKNNHYLFDLDKTIDTKELMNIIKSNSTYVNVVSHVQKHISENDSFEDIKPLNWESAYQKYLIVENEYSWLDRYKMDQEKDIQEFNGTIVHYTENRNFCLNISIENILYDEVHQGNKAHKVLLESIVLHLIDCLKHNNFIMNK